MDHLSHMANMYKQNSIDQQNASEVQSATDAGADAGGEALPQESAPETIDDAQGITNCKCGKFNVVISRLETDGDVDDE